MGANAQTAVPVFTSGQVLTAAQVTQINTGIPVFATTVTRDAAFGGTGEKALAQGQTCYIEATSTYQTYNGSAWVSLVTAPGLTLIKSQTIGSAVSSVTVSDAFSATYDNYKIVVSGGVGSVSIENLNMTLGATATGYFWARNGRTIADTDASGASGGGGGVSWRAGGSSTTTLSMSMELFNPFLADETLFNSYNMYVATNGTVFTTQGFLNNTTSYTAFTLTPASGTITGGTIRVYGYANS